jgi:hypothetical protein
MRALTGLTLLAAATVAPPVLATEYLAGTADDDTIVYGELVVRVMYGQCYYYVSYGPGVCVFERDDSIPYRGALVAVAAWADPDAHPLGIFGDPSGGGYGADVVYAADQFGESFVTCGSYGGLTWYVAIEHTFHGVGLPCSYVTTDATFPEDATLEIWGDGPTVQYGQGDFIYGWNNDDALQGGGGGDTIHGGGGNDSLYGGFDGDWLYGDSCSLAGTEYFYGGNYDDGADALIGGTGGCNAEMYGGGGPDWLIGTDYDDVMDGGPGDKDHVEGNGGDDELSGGTGSYDECYGGDGDYDTCYYSPSCEERFDCELP